MGFILVSSFLCITLANLVSGNCPLSGCTPSRSYTSEVDTVNTTANPPMLWSSVKYKPLGSGCATNGDRIVCPLASSEDARLISWDIGGKSPWTVTLEGEVNLPLMDISGGLIATDGTVLVGYDSAGNPFGEPVLLVPVQGSVFDLTITSNNIAVLLYKCGFIATYLTDGVPHAGLWLNETVHGAVGTFIPLINAAVSGNRLYIISAFKPHMSQPKKQPQRTNLRIYAIDIRSSINDRIKVVWQKDLTLNGTLPYLTDIETICVNSHYGHHNRQRNTATVRSSNASPHLTHTASITAFDQYVVVAVNYHSPFTALSCNNSSPCPQNKLSSESLLVIIRDDVPTSNSTVLFMEQSSSLILSLAELANDDTTLGRTSEHLRSDEFHNVVTPRTFWMNVLKSTADNSSSANCTYLQERNAENGYPVRTVNMCKILQKDTVVATTDITLLKTRPSVNVSLANFNTVSQVKSTVLKPGTDCGGRSTGASGSKQNSHCMLRNGTVIFVLGLMTQEEAVLGETDNPISYSVIAVEVLQDSARLIWHWPIPEPAAGQITTVNGASNSVMVVTTKMATYVYAIG